MSPPEECINPSDFLPSKRSMIEQEVDVLPSLKMVKKMIKDKKRKDGKGDNEEL
jgi:hypothetical protein